MDMGESAAMADESLRALLGEAGASAFSLFSVVETEGKVDVVAVTEDVLEEELEKGLPGTDGSF